ncbi:MAG: hypothetical protein J2P21_29525 [Chloracidobacterium sp.]|nr:hypothetical protein [Chloracidobacterium sp.]
MKQTLRSFSLLIILSMAYPLTIVMVRSSAKAQDLSKSGIDYQKTADSADWGWEDEKANSLWSISQSGGKYGIVMVSEPGDRFSRTFKVLLGDKEVYSCGHENRVFRILEDRLYYARFHPNGNGGSVEAIDLSTGRNYGNRPCKASA